MVAWTIGASTKRDLYSIKKTELIQRPMHLTKLDKSLANQLYQIRCPAHRSKFVSIHLRPRLPRKKFRISPTLSLGLHFIRQYQATQISRSLTTAAPMSQRRPLHWCSIVRYLEVDAMTSTQGPSLSSFQHSTATKSVRAGNNNRLVGCRARAVLKNLIKNHRIKYFL